MAKIYIVAWSGSAGFEADSPEDAIEQAKQFMAWDATSTFTLPKDIGTKGETDVQPLHTP